MLVRKRNRRSMESAFRAAGLIVVDEWGARIDESQFEKELNPDYNKDVGPSGWRILYESFAPVWLINWGFRRHMRQSSDGSGTD
jgi:hypothetical protein